MGDIMKTKRIFVIVAALIIVIILILSGNYIYKFIRDKSEDKKNKEVIEAVVTQIFTCPNEELINLYQKMYQQMAKIATKSEEEPKTEPNYSSLIEDKLKEVYGPYFTDRAYTKFKMKYIINYYVYATAMDYNVTLDRVKIVRSETIPSNYSFIVSVKYGPEGSSLKEMEIEGSAQLYEEPGKLSYIQFIESKLYRELRDKGPGY
jgi:hypothetical protein